MNDLVQLNRLDAHDAVARLARREITAVELLRACLERIAAREAEVRAFVRIDADAALAQARALDAGPIRGPLHGLPLGVKDLLDTADLPTAYGTPLYARHQPGADAAAVALCREAGAVIVGKTVTTELAYFNPGPTRNPLAPAHTPGGSSSGSAAAVADAMLPLALGTQTAGSIIRPAAYCGIVGFKPSFGRVPRTGVLAQCRPLDTVGVFGRTVADAALIADALAGHDPGDPDTRLAPPPRLLDTALTEPPVIPAFAFVKSPVWHLAEESTKDGFAELVEALGKACEEVALPEVYGEGAMAQRTLNLAGIARNYGRYAERGAAELSDFMRGAIADGRKVTAVDYLTALDWQVSLNAGLDQLFDRYDAILTPAATGEAPHGLHATGNPAFCSLWSLCGVPAISLPLLRGPNGLPVGVQLVGRRGEDARLLRTARWLMNAVEQASEGEDDA